MIGSQFSNLYTAVDAVFEIVRDNDIANQVHLHALWLLFLQEQIKVIIIIITGDPASCHRQRPTRVTATAWPNTALRKKASQVVPPPSDVYSEYPAAAAAAAYATAWRAPPGDCALFKSSVPLSVQTLTQTDPLNRLLWCVPS